MAQQQHAHRSPRRALVLQSGALAALGSVATAAVVVWGVSAVGPELAERPDPHALAGASLVDLAPGGSAPADSPSVAVVGAPERDTVPADALPAGRTSRAVPLDAVHSPPAPLPRATSGAGAPSRDGADVTPAAGASSSAGRDVAAGTAAVAGPALPWTAADRFQGERGLSAGGPVRSAVRVGAGPSRAEDDGTELSGSTTAAGSASDEDLTVVKGARVARAVKHRAALVKAARDRAAMDKATRDETARNETARTSAAEARDGEARATEAEAPEERAADDRGAEDEATTRTPSRVPVAVARRPAPRSASTTIGPGPSRKASPPSSAASVSDRASSPAPRRGPDEERAPGGKRASGGARGDKGTSQSEGSGNSKGHNGDGGGSGKGHNGDGGGNGKGHNGGGGKGEGSNPGGDKGKGSNAGGKGESKGKGQG